MIGDTVRQAARLFVGQMPLKGRASDGSGDFCQCSIGLGIITLTKHPLAVVNPAAPQAFSGAGAPEVSCPSAAMVAAGVAVLNLHTSEEHRVCPTKKSFPNSGAQ
jgi:hypothetical protein